MIRFALVVFISLAFASNVVGQDYLLRIDTVVSDLVPQPGQKPQSKRVRSIEVIAQPGGKFYAKTSVQGNTYILSGRLRAEPKGLMAELKYRHTAAPVQLASTRTPPPPGTSFSTTLLAAEGKPLLVTGKVVSMNGKPAQLREDTYFTITKFSDHEL